MWCDGVYITWMYGGVLGCPQRMTEPINQASSTRPAAVASTTCERRTQRLLAMARRGTIVS